MIIKKLNSAIYGDPQLRERIFFFGIREALPMNGTLIVPDPIINDINFLMFEIN